MVREFKKTGVAAALTGALLATASMSSQAAVQLSAPGDVVLVPYVVCDLKAGVNTLVGLTTFSKTRLGLLDAGGKYLPAPAALAGVIPAATPTLPNTGPSGKSTVHWYFFNSRSEHVLDGIIPITDNDFVRFDWCTTINTLNQSVLSGVKGYLLFVDDAFDRTGATVPTYAFYGHSYQISGNWASQAFIPVISNPVYSVEGGNQVWNVQKVGGYPKILRLVAGTDYTSTRSGSHRDLYMRYFLDPALATANSMVFWFNNNQDVLRAQVPGETYDSEQNYLASFSTSLKDELNVITHTPTDPKFPGMIHQETETYGGKFTVVNSGIVRLGIPELTSNVGYYSSGVSFNMLGIGAGANAGQIQTEMATESAAY